MVGMFREDTAHAREAFNSGRPDDRRPPPDTQGGVIGGDGLINTGFARPFDASTAQPSDSTQ
jgi:hypothetical protein